MKLRRVGAAVLALGGLAPAPDATAQTRAPITTATSDGVTIYGEPYFSSLPATAPLILAFHQGGSNGRGEYSELAAWLNGLGYRVIAWDQRAGGSVHGSENRTVAGLGGVETPDFCATYRDLEAALNYVTESGLARSVVIWGSSYSGSLVFRLGAEHGDTVDGVIAFSPASGGPMEGCRARLWVNHVAAPVIAFRPESEMGRPAAEEQREVLAAAGVEFHVVEGGVHGSSMLMDARTGRSMDEARAIVSRWLVRVATQ